jgi:hypothetical protein
MVVQKYPVPKRLLIYPLAALFTLTSVSTFVNYLSQRDNYSCDAGDLLPKDLNTYKTHPVKVVASPWRGQHHVYGIFMIPEEFQPNSMSVVEIEGSGSYYRKVVSEKQWTNGMQADPGYYFTKTYIRTRTVLGWSVFGFLPQFRKRCNWTLTYTKQ